jgi:hypothetical protein
MEAAGVALRRQIRRSISGTATHLTGAGIRSNKTNAGIDIRRTIGDHRRVATSQVPAGLQIFNTNPPADKLGAYDTIVGGDGNPNFIGYDGNWGVYPFFGTTRSFSDMDTGWSQSMRRQRSQQWTGRMNAKWQDSTKWDEGDVLPDSSEIVHFRSANRTVTRSMTVTSLSRASWESNPVVRLHDPADQQRRIEMKSSAGAATIKMPPSGALLAKITAPLLLSSDLTVTNDAGLSVSPTLELGLRKGRASSPSPAAVTPLDRRQSQLQRQHHRQRRNAHPA